MFVITHALAPVVVTNALSALQLTRASTSRLFTNAQLIMIGIAGAAPDLLSPHWKLSARLQSPTHTIWFLLGIYPVCLLVGRWLGQPRPWLIAHCMWLAVLLHLICDALAGGIAWVYPLNQEILGGQYVPLPLWFLSDAGFFAITVFLQRWVSALEMKRDGELLMERHGSKSSLSFSSTPRGMRSS
ncbi:MAG: metal-dependent hydrolase [Verrucomicrobia bacterium]|nr:metal-dependent hydrolase [Verrucomicrobiota bacterium]